MIFLILWNFYFEMIFEGIEVCSKVNYRYLRSVNFIFYMYYLIFIRGSDFRKG